MVCMLEGESDIGFNEVDVGTTLFLETWVGGRDDWTI